MPILFHISCISPPLSVPKHAKTRVFYTFAPYFEACFLHYFVTPLKIFCDTIDDTIAKMHLLKHRKTEAASPPFLRPFLGLFLHFVDEIGPFCYAFVTTSIGLYASRS